MNILIKSDRKTRHLSPSYTAVKSLDENVSSKLVLRLYTEYVVLIGERVFFRTNMYTLSLSHEDEWISNIVT